MTMLSRLETLRLILSNLPDGDVVVFANGFISREGCSIHDDEKHFYMLGSMGLAGAIGLGVALACPQTGVVVIDGDGNLLMGLAVMPMIGAWKPARLLHVVLDNGTYGSTGSQPTLSSTTDFPAVAKASGYPTVLSVAGKDAVLRGLKTSRNRPGPVMLHIRVSALEPKPPPPRVVHQAQHIATRFAAVLRGDR
jgi:thiamine pyrophosphate-dependent acetolactate synthase large subunit-like protein